ncbi:MAG: AI-2E family transporter [Chloroflexota bacterium]|nr:AI-2E family transporter [Chloroflexota bacterium]
MFDKVSDRFIQRVIVAGLILVSLVIVLWFLWNAADVLLLFFSGILLAVLLRALTELVSAHTRLTGRWAYGAVVLALVALFAGSGWLFASDLGGEIDNLSETAPQSIGQLTTQIRQYEWGQALLERVPTEVGDGTSGRLLSQVLSGASQGVTLLAYLGIIVVVGLYLAAEPDLYVNGFVRLFPPQKRESIRDILHDVGETLQLWLLAQLLSMTTVGILIALGLWLLGMPLVLTLSLIAGLSEFIPSIGPLLGAIPAVLVALTVGPTKVLQVVALFVVVQIAESNLIMPLIQKWAVEIPPALLIVTILMMGLLFGWLGAFVATPLLAVTILLVKELYIEEVLDEPVELAIDDEPSFLSELSED